MSFCFLQDVLPSYPLSGMLNKHGGKVRLTFKLELDQIWIGTKERTEKINMNHIRQIVSEAIDGYEQYHIMVIVLEIYTISVKRENVDNSYQRLSYAEFRTTNLFVLISPKKQIT